MFILFNKIMYALHNDDTETGHNLICFVEEIFLFHRYLLLFVFIVRLVLT